MNAQQLKNSILQDLFSPKDNWKEKELKDIVSKKCPISYGIVQQGDHVEDGIPVVRPVDLHCKFVSRKNLKCTTPDISASYQRTILRGDEILLCVRGTTGIVALATNEIEGCNVNRGIVPLFFDGDIDRMFMYYQLQTPKIQETISSNTMGSALRQINIKDLRSILLTYPPIDEQREVVEILETIMPKVDEYGKAQEALDKLNEELPERLKKSILQEAIEGRLVPQDPNDEPASVLLDKIRKEKAKLVKEGKLKKKDLVEIPIAEDEKPFEIPESWEWHRIGFLASLYTGNSISKDVKESKYINVKGRWYIGTKDVNFDNTINYDNGVYIPEKEEQQFKIAPSGSILMCIEGGSAGRKIGIIDRDVCFGNKLCCFLSYGIFNMFIYYYLQSSIFKEIFNDNKKGIIGGVSINMMSPLLIPVPPLAEQHRIVEKIEQLMKEIDKLKV